MAQNINLREVKDESVKRKINKFIQNIGIASLPSEDLEEYNKLVSEMQKLFSTAKVPQFNNSENLVTLDPEMTLALAESRNPQELEYYWDKHRETTGGKMKAMYQKYIDLTNQAAK